MGRHFYRITLNSMITYLAVSALNPAVAATQPSKGQIVHFCGGNDFQLDQPYPDPFPNRRYNRSFAKNLNVGEPRTVRMIYFLPNDRPYRAEVVQRMKDEIRKIQTFYAEQMNAHGHGDVSFRFETDDEGEPTVHHVDGGQPDRYYEGRGDRLNFFGVINEVNRIFDLNVNIYFIIIDNSAGHLRGAGGRRGKNGGYALLTSNYFWATAHELGHAFGLQHDFNDDAYIMSYGWGAVDTDGQISECHADYLSVHPYFNLKTSTAVGILPAMKLISPRTYTAGSQSVPVRLELNDAEGLLQVLLFVRTIEPHAAAGYLEVKACHGLTGAKDTVVEFDYDGVVPSNDWTSLSYAATHAIYVYAVDMDGNVTSSNFGFAEISPHHVTTLRHTDGVLSVSFSPNGMTLAAGAGETVKLWDVATQSNIFTFRHTDDYTHGVTSVSFSRDGMVLASCGGDTVNLWDVATGRNSATIGHTSWFRSVSVAPNGMTVASGGDDGRVRLWDAATQQAILTLEGHMTGVTSVAYSSDGRTLASGSMDGTVKLWDVAAQQEFATLEGHRFGFGVTSVVFSLDGKMLASGSRDSTVMLWDVAAQHDLATLEGHTNWVNSLAFSFDGSILASASTDRTVKLWDIPTRVDFATLGHTHAVYSVAFSSDGRTLASGTDDGTVELWDTSGWVAARLEAVEEIHIPDANLGAAFADAIGQQASASFIRANLESLTRLEAVHANISDLTGLESATNLRILNLANNSISDISAVTGLPNLTSLNLGNNSISHISSVPGWTNLTKLDLSNNSVSDISGLVGLRNLTWLDLRNNSLSYISSLGDLSNLTALFLAGNSISDIPSVPGWTNLTKLDLSNNSVSDISGLVGLPNLTVLFLGGNNISDMSAVTGLPNLSELYLQDNNITDMSPAASLTNLARLNLAGNSILDISAIAGLVNLTELYLEKNLISDISPLAENGGLGEGDRINVWGNRLSYASIYTHLPTLQTRGVDVHFIDRTPTTLVKISGDQNGAPAAPMPNPFVVEVRDEYGEAFAGVPVTFDITAGNATLDFASTETDAEGRAECALTLGPDLEINTVSVSAAEIEAAVTFTAVAREGIIIRDYNLHAAFEAALGLASGDRLVASMLTTLTHLDAQNVGINDLTGLELATNLMSLNLAGNNISDISLISSLINLTSLNLSSNSISDISAISGLSNLTWLNLRGNKISDVTAVMNLTNLAVLDLYNNSVSDVSAAADLVNLTWLNLQRNSISDLSPLAANSGLAGGDEVYAAGNTLNYPSIYVHIPTLQMRGAFVSFSSRTPTSLVKISGDNQIGAPTDVLTKPVVFEVQDQFGRVFSGVPVTLTVTEGGGTLNITSTTTDAQGRAESTLTLGSIAGVNSVRVSVEGISEPQTFTAIGELPAFDLTVPTGISLIHIPLNVVTVNEAPLAIDSISDLYDALGGLDAVNFLVTRDVQRWQVYFGDQSRGTTGDKVLTDDLGIIAAMKDTVTLRLSGGALGRDGHSMMMLHPGANLVGVPLRNSRISRVSDLFSLDGIRYNVPSIIVSDYGEFREVSGAGDDGDVPLTGGQSFVLEAREAASVSIAGETWGYFTRTAAAPELDITGIKARDATPVLAMSGSIVDEVTVLNRRGRNAAPSASGFRVTVRNLSTGIAVTDVTGDEQPNLADKESFLGVGYQLAVVDMASGRAAQIGDVLEVSAETSSPLIRVRSLRYTVTAADVANSRIKLPELTAYQIPTETALLPNYPNPFNPETWIPYQLAEDADVALTIYDAKGETVRRLDLGHQMAGYYADRGKSAYWDGRNNNGESVASGLYFYQLKTPSFRQTRRMVILK